jgi:hypothetical protein
MYIRVLFMSEFPGLRHIVKIRDFFPYLRVQSDPLAKMAGTKPVRLATLQIHIEGVATLQIHTVRYSHSSDPN